MKSVIKWLSDPDADDYPFPHKIGERLRSQSKNLEGIVRNAKYAGTEDGDSAWITYYLETDTGEIIQLPSAELEKSALSRLLINTDVGKKTQTNWNLKNINDHYLKLGQPDNI